jgi:hypothetical protein
MLGCSHVQGYIYEKPLSARGRHGPALLVAGCQRRRSPAVRIGEAGTRNISRQTMLRKVQCSSMAAEFAKPLSTAMGTIRNISLPPARR